MQSSKQTKRTKQPSQANLLTPFTKIPEILLVFYSVSITVSPEPPFTLDRRGLGKAYVRYINIQTWLIVNFLSFFCLSISKWDLDTKKTTPNMDICPESAGAIPEY